MGVIFAISVVCIVIGCMSSLLVPMKSTESSFRKKTMTPHLVAVTILLPIILIAWIFGMVGTDYGVTGAASTVTQYIFGCILMIHAVILLILTLIRTEDTRKAWIRLLKCKTGTTGKYAFSQDVTMENDYADREGIGLEASTRKEKEKLRSISSEDEEISFVSDVINTGICSQQLLCTVMHYLVFSLFCRVEMKNKLTQCLIITESFVIIRTQINNYYKYYYSSAIIIVIPPFLINNKFDIV